MNPAIEITQLSKRFEDVIALENITLSIPQGEFFGLLGPNGAGKTTLIRLIIGLARRSAGSAKIFGMDVEQHPLQTKALLACSPQESNVDRTLTVRRILEYHGGYYGLNRHDRKVRAEELLEQFRLTEKINTPYWRLSGGMQKRVMVARSLMSRPKILMLDEPSAAIDVEQRHELWESMKGLNRDGTTIILTTHYIDEAELLCERVGIIHFGHIVACDTPQQLIQNHCDRFFRVKGKRIEQLNGYTVDDVEVQKGSLEDVFLKLTGYTLHEDHLNNLHLGTSQKGSDARQPEEAD